MSRAFVPGLKAEKSVTLRRLRELPIPGELKVRVGDSVTATQIVARAQLPGELYILRVAEKLGIEAFEVMAGLKVAVGAGVQKGDLLCEHAGLFGLFKSRFVAPETGTIEFITERTGHIGLRLPSEPIEIDAFISGEVVSVIENKAVEIETRAALIQGIFGVGGEKQGTISLLKVAPEKELAVADIPQDCSGKILAGGMRPSIDVLRMASKRGAVGLVTGSVDDRALKEFLGFDLGIALTGDEDLSMTLIITEGFGSIAISKRILDLLRPLEGKQASINGATQVRAGAVRPEIIVPQAEAAAETKKLDADEGLCVGRNIRIIRVPYFGERATVSELPQKVEQIETGAKARVLRAKLERSGEVVTVPRANVELL